MEKQGSSSISETSSRYRCLHGTLHVVNGMKLLVGVGTLSILALLILEIIYFRRAIFVLSIPTCVVAFTVAAIIRQNTRLVWPIISISCFHIFISLYAGLIFLYYFFFKPLYIIMILNWAFDTLHTGKTASFYLSSLAIIAGITIFGLFNLWQLFVSLHYQEFLDSYIESSMSSLAPILPDSINMKRTSADFGPTILVVNRNSENFDGLPNFKNAVENNRENTSDTKRSERL